MATTTPLTKRSEPMITRKDYMSGKATHAEYYGQWADTLSPFVVAAIGKRALLNSSDPNLNDIPLHRWDAMHATVLQVVGCSIGEANGTGAVSLSDTVCAAKAAARQYLHEV